MLGHTMPCLPGHNIYNAMTSRPYHIPCHADQALPYILPWPPGHTMPCPADHSVYNVMPARPYRKPCRVGRGSSRPSSRNSKGTNGHVTRCTTVMSIVKADNSFLRKLLLFIDKRSVMHCGSVMDSLPCFSQSLKIVYAHGRRQWWRLQIDLFMERSNLLTWKV